MNSIKINLSITQSLLTSCSSKARRGTKERLRFRQFGTRYHASCGREEAPYADKYAN